MKPRKPAARLPWIGYIRVSTDEQASSGLGLASQEEKVRAMAVVKEVNQGFEVIADEGASASSLDRPGVARLMELIEGRKVAGVIIAKLDRLTRSIKDLGRLTEMLKKHGVSLISAAESFDTATASGRMVLNMIGVIAQWEREVICERTRDGLAQLKKRGEHAGMVRYGYRSSGLKKHEGSGRLVPDEAEQRIVALIHEARSANLTLADIAARLNADGYRTRRGTPWRLQYVDSVLRQAALAGNTTEEKEK